VVKKVYIELTWIKNTIEQNLFAVHEHASGVKGTTIQYTDLTVEQWGTLGVGEFQYFPAKQKEQNASNMFY